MDQSYDETACCQAQDSTCAQTSTNVQPSDMVKDPTMALGLTHEKISQKKTMLINHLIMDKQNHEKQMHMEEMDLKMKHLSMGWCRTLVKPR